MARPLMVSHFPSKNPAKRRNAFRTSTEISCPSPVACLQRPDTRRFLRPDRLRPAPEADRAWENRIASVKCEFASGVRRFQPDVLQHFICGGVQIEIRRRCRMTQFLFSVSVNRSVAVLVHRGPVIVVVSLVDLFHASYLLSCLCGPVSRRARANEAVRLLPRFLLVRVRPRNDFPLRARLLRRSFA